MLKYVRRTCAFQLFGCARCSKKQENASTSAETCAHPTLRTNSPANQNSQVHEPARTSVPARPRPSPSFSENHSSKDTLTAQLHLPSRASAPGPDLRPAGPARSERLTGFLPRPGRLSGLRLPSGVVRSPLPALPPLLAVFGPFPVFPRVVNHRKRSGCVRAGDRDKKQRESSVETVETAALLSAKVL